MRILNKLKRGLRLLMIKIQRRKPIYKKINGDLVNVRGLNLRHQKGDSLDAFFIKDGAELYVGKIDNISNLKYGQFLIINNRKKLLGGDKTISVRFHSVIDIDPQTLRDRLANADKIHRAEDPNFTYVPLGGNTYKEFYDFYNENRYRLHGISSGYFVGMILSARERTYTEKVDFHKFVLVNYCIGWDVFYELVPSEDVVGLIKYFEI